MPHALTAEQKADHVASCKYLLAVHRRDPAFLTTIVTGMNRGVSLTPLLLNDRVRNGRARGVWDHKNCGGKNHAWRRCWSCFLICVAWSILSSFLRSKRWTWTSTNMCSTNCWNGSRACGRICACPRPGACCTIMHPRITPSSFGSFYPKRTSQCCTTHRIRRIWSCWLLFIPAPQDSTERSLVWWCISDLESCNARPEGHSGLRLHLCPRSVGWLHPMVCRCGRGIYWIKYTCFAILSCCRFFRASVLKISCHTVYYNALKRESSL